ncbi:MAG TPA: hypothetical protein VMM81_05515 [Acidimicrobiia bacterium]|nr:hypothetical protein [Acidimicrobiia bacterium]
MNKRLSAPYAITFWISVILIAVGMLGYYTGILDLGADTAFLLVSAGGVLLAIGCLFKGI